MKNVVLFSLLLFAGVFFSDAQTQRMVMYEGFTSANCPPCVPQNAFVNELIPANPTKVVSLKYHTNWPGGADFSNTHTQTWVGPRVSYYGVTGVPSTRVDGTGTSISQTVINTRYAAPSPFLLEVNHTFNAAEDSVFIEVIIEAAQNFTGTQLVLHTAMVEKHIGFTNAPGSNGERDFYNVMRRMYPDASGTSLPSSWTSGQVETYSFAAPIPAYIYQFSQIAFVAFIQSNQDKTVHQATKTIPDRYITILSHNIPKNPMCDDNIDLQVTVINQGKTPITSFDLEYGIDGQTPSTYNWNGSLTYGETAVVNLPNITLPGAVIVFATVKNPNGSTNASDDFTHVEGLINIVENYSAIPVSQEFTSTAFPPADWIVVNEGNIGWERHTAGGFGNTPGGSARAKFYDISSNGDHFLYMEGLNLTSTDPVSLKFSVAHAMYSTTLGPNDRLRVEISTNCGQSWTNIYDKSGTTLATAPITTSSFVPTATQWRSETIDLSGYSTQDEILIRFRANSGYGNNLYIDDVNIASTADITEISISDHITVYPNPAEDILTVDVLISNSTDMLFYVYDITGKLVLTFPAESITGGNEEQFSLDISKLHSGLYHLVVVTESGVTTKKIAKH
jgi:hypothetical protein